MPGGASRTQMGGRTTWGIKILLPQHSAGGRRRVLWVQERQQCSREGRAAVKRPCWGNRNTVQPPTYLSQWLRAEHSTRCQVDREHLRIRYTILQNPWPQCSRIYNVAWGHGECSGGWDGIFASMWGAQNRNWGKQSSVGIVALRVVPAILTWRVPSLAPITMLKAKVITRLWKVSKAV